MFQQLCLLKGMLNAGLARPRQTAARGGPI